MNLRRLCLGVLFVSATGATASAAPLLAVDVNDRTVGDPTATDPANTAAGFEAWLMDTGTTTTRTLTSGYTVQVDVFDDGDANDGGAAGNQAGAYDDRDRVVPTTAGNLNEVYDDFIFAGASAGPAGGLDVKISGGSLLPSTQYLVSIYAYDGIDANMASATPTRTASWLDGNNADLAVTTATFTINQPPTGDEYKFTGIAVTDSTGRLFLKGRRVTAADVAVYLDGLEVSMIPEPGVAMLGCLAAVALCGRRRRR
jgi:hypothetical protein